jgi:murein L,D-transpeptidase YcbB/YkuD
MKQRDVGAMMKLLKWAGNYLGVVFYSLIIFSCSKNITQQSNTSKTPMRSFSADPIVTTQEAPIEVQLPGDPAAIDSLRYTLAYRYNVVVARDSYFNQRVKNKVEKFYKGSGSNTMWLYDHAPNNLFYALTYAIKNASLYGLCAEDYDVIGIEERAKSIYEKSPVNINDIIDLDVHITDMYFLFTTHLMEGKVRTSGYDGNIWIREIKTSPDIDVTMLTSINRPEQIAELINHIQPASEQYRRLQKALARYRELDKSNVTLPAISIGSAIKPEERNQAVALIRRKLSLSNLKVYPMMVDSLTGAMDSLYYDRNLVDAVKFFQLKHGLEPDGIIGDKTLRFINQSFSDKADVIAINMERLRWLSNETAENIIKINVPEYKLRVFESKKPTLEMKVIVGAANNPTPIFNDALDNIVFSPTWTVPVSIIKDEIIPRLKKNPAYYAQKNYAFYKNEVEIDPTSETWDDESINPYQYRVVQGPGPDNALGLVKFIMPNNMSVYLHDTPNHRLFSKDYRALSHGCVRLDEPDKFAEYLLRDQQGWNMERIQKAMNDAKPATIRLKKRYQVSIEYRTAWVDDNGDVNFREDIYGYDKMQIQQLHAVTKSSSVYAGL